MTDHHHPHDKARGTALKRVQTLEKDFAGFHEQLSQLPQILGDPNLSNSVRPERAAITPAGVGRFQGRSDWALRWLLTKLGSSQSVGSEARASPQAWTSLRRLIHNLPPAATARELARSKFLSIVESALAESFSWKDSSAVLSNYAYEVAKDEKYVSDADAFEGEHFAAVDSSRGGKKRKRDSSSRKPKHEALPKGTNDVHLPDVSAMEEKLDLFRSIALTLDDLSNAARTTFDSNSSDKRLAEYLKSVLRVECESAASLLGHWVDATNVIGAMASHTKFDDEVRRMCSLKPALSIWDNRVTRPEDAADLSSIEFSKHCLLPLMRYLRICKDRMAVLGAENTPGIKSEDVSAAEKLIARFIFISTKSLDERTGSEKENEVTPNGTKLAARLESIYVHLYEGKENFEGSVYKSLVAAAVPDLMDIAIRCSGLSSPQNRLKEYPWLERVLLALSSSLGLEILKPLTGRETPPLIIRQLEKMLSLARRNNLRISADTLCAIVEKYANVSSPTSKNINWGLISNVLALDRTVFVDTRFQKVGHVERMKLGETVLNKITDEAWMTDDGQIDSNESLKFELIKSSTVVPFLKAYASARQLGTFLMMWRDQLVRFLRDSHQIGPRAVQHQEYPPFSVWQDDEIVDCLGELVESSMAQSQIESSVAIFSNKISAIIDGNDKVEVAIQLIANAAVLRGLLNSLKGDPVRLVAASKCDRLLEEIFSKLGLLDVPSKPSVTASLWGLVCSLHRLKAECEAPQIFNPTSQKMFEATVSKVVANFHQTVKPNKYEDEVQREAVMSLACLGGIMFDRHGRNLSCYVDPESTKQIFQRAKDVISGPEESSYSFSLALASTFASYPALLQPSNGEAADDSYRLDFIQAFGSAALDSGIVLRRCWLNVLNFAGNENSTLLDDLIHVFVDLLAETGGQFDLDLKSDDDYAFLIEAISLIDPQRIDSELTKPIIEFLIRRLSWNAAIGTVENMLCCLATLAKFAESPQSVRVVRKTMIKNHDVLWTIFQRCDSVFFEFLQEAPARKALLTGLKDVLTNSLALCYSEKHAREADGFLNEICHRIVEDTAPEFDKHPTTVFAVASALSVVPASSQKHSARIRTELGKVLCEGLCEAIPELYKEFQSSKKESIFYLLPLLEALSVLDESTLLEHGSKVEGVISNGAKVVSGNNLADETQALQIELILFNIDNRLKSAKGETIDTVAALQICRRQLSAAEVSYLRRIVDSSVNRFTEEQAQDLVQTLLNSPDDPSLRLLNLAIPSLNSRKHLKLTSPSVSHIIAALTHRLSTTSSYATFKSITSTLHHLLTHNSADTTQHDIESLLLTLTHLLSLTSPSFPPNRTSSILTALLAIPSTLLSTPPLRLKLKGRSHLLLPLLQSLHRTFFHLPNLQPPWLSPSRVTAIHASTYARLLTTWCSPSPTRASSSLIDDAREARIYAGRFAAPLLATHARCLLDGHIVSTPSDRASDATDKTARQALTQGIYALFDAAVAAGLNTNTSASTSDGDRDRRGEGSVLASLNAAAGPDARSVLRGLWEDYKKFGRWDGKA